MSTQYNKSLMYPDRVLTLVVLFLSIMMIGANAYLYSVPDRFENTGANIIVTTNQRVDQMKAQRQPAQESELEETE